MCMRTRTCAGKTEMIRSSSGKGPELWWCMLKVMSGPRALMRSHVHTLTHSVAHLFDWCVMWRVRVCSTTRIPPQLRCRNIMK